FRRPLCVSLCDLCASVVTAFYKTEHRDTKITQRGTEEEKTARLLRRWLCPRDQACEEIDSVSTGLSRFCQAAEVARLLAQFVHARTRKLSVLASQVLLRDPQCLGFAIELQQQVHIHLGRERAPLRGRGLDLVAEMLQTGFDVVTVQDVEQ